MCAGRRRSGVWPISIPSSHSHGHSHICVTMVMLIRWLMTIHQWRCLIGQPPRALWNVFISAACVLALPQYAPQDDDGASLLLSVCFSTFTSDSLVLISPPTPPLFSLITCPLLLSHPFLSQHLSLFCAPLPCSFHLVLIDEGINHRHIWHELLLTSPKFLTAARLQIPPTPASHY